ncbi:MAG TPA: PAS domain S-box protein [Gemmatales bacterium]|nr:PAS domain S-box protein [Gemmatales bacterium]
MSRAKRALLMVAALLPTVMVVLAAWLVGVSAGLVFAGISAACISMAVTYVATIGPRRHQDALDQIQDSLQKNLEDEAHLVRPWEGADPPPWTMTALTVELCRRLAERRKQLKRTMLDVTNALASLTHPLNPPATLPPPPCPDPDDGRTLSSTYHIHAKNFQIIRTRELAMTSLLKDMPIALIATDLELKIHYVNPVAEQLFGLQAARLQQLTLTKLFSDPPAALLNKDVSLPHGLGPKAFYQRLVDHKTKDLIVWIRNAQGDLVPATAIVKLGQHHVFQFLPLTDPLKEPVSSKSQSGNKQLAAI